MAEGTRTKTGERVWVVKREDDVEGKGGRIHFIRPAEEEDVQGHPMRHLSPEGDDTEQGLYLAVVDSEDDVTGQRLSRRPGLEQEGDDAEGQASRRN